MILIKGCAVILEIIVQWLEESATLSTNLMEAGVDISQERISLEQCSSDQVSVCAAVVKFWHGKVELEGLGLLPYAILVVSREGIETSKLMPSGAEFRACVEVKSTSVGPHHWKTEQVVGVDAIYRSLHPFCL